MCPPEEWLKNESMAFQQSLASSLSQMFTSGHVPIAGAMAQPNVIDVHVSDLESPVHIVFPLKVSDVTTLFFLAPQSLSPA